MKHGKEKKKIDIFKIIIAILIVIIVFCSIKIIGWLLNNRQNKIIQKKLSKYMVFDVENTENSKVDFEGLKKINNDTVGVLTVKGTDVEYVVVRGEDNSYYLTHNFEKKYNKAGWIFADYRNKFDGTDKNIIIYGHNRRDGSMFSSLNTILNKEWYENDGNLKINFITENENAIYQVFSIYQIEDEDYYIQTDFSNQSFEEFLKKLKQRSIKNFGIEVTEEDQIITLSTCANNNAYRTVLHAKKI